MLDRKEATLRIFVGITDGDWYSFLSQGEVPEEINFWQPSGSTQFRALQPGEPFLFKLHSPQDYIVGGGFFGHFSIAPVSLAWSAFGPKNGAQTEQEMRSRIERYRRKPPTPTEDYSVGCILLQAPFFFDRADWIPVPEWSKSIVRGKGYDSDTEPGRSLWDQVSMRLAAIQNVGESLLATAEGGPRFGEPHLIQPRLGQGSFRIAVTDAYGRHCAFTRSPVLPVLEAAHIQPFSAGGPHSIRNGLLLRQDLHTILDRGYMTVTPDYRVEVSRRIREEFDNGKEYYALQGSSIFLPATKGQYPSTQFLKWHNENIFRD